MPVAIIEIGYSSCLEQGILLGRQLVDQGGRVTDLEFLIPSCTPACISSFQGIDPVHVEIHGWEVHVNRTGQAVLGGINAG